MISTLKLINQATSLLFSTLKYWIAIFILTGLFHYAQDFYFNEGIIKVLLDVFEIGLFIPIVVGAAIISLQIKRTVDISLPTRDELVNRIMWLCVWSIIQNLIYIAGIILLVIPALILIVRMAFIDQAIMLEGSSKPLHRSFELTRGRFWYFAPRVWALVLPAYLIPLGISALFPKESLYGDLITDLLGTLTVIWVTVGITILYAQENSPIDSKTPSLN